MKTGGIGRLRSLSWRGGSCSSYLRGEKQPEATTSTTEATPKSDNYFSGDPVLRIYVSAEHKIKATVSYTYKLEYAKEYTVNKLFSMRTHCSCGLSDQNYSIHRIYSHPFWSYSN